MLAVRASRTISRQARLLSNVGRTSPGLDSFPVPLPASPIGKKTPPSSDQSDSTPENGTTPSGWKSWALYRHRQPILMVLAASMALNASFTLVQDGKKHQAEMNRKDELIAALTAQIRQLEEQKSGSKGSSSASPAKDAKPFVGKV